MKKSKKVETQTQQPKAPVCLAPTEAKKYVVQCPRCSAKLNVKNSGVAYMCPVCNTLFRMRTGKKMVKDVSPVIVSEAYVNVTKEANEK